MRGVPPFLGANSGSLSYRLGQRFPAAQSLSDGQLHYLELPEAPSCRDMEGLLHFCMLEGEQSLLSPGYTPLREIAIHSMMVPSLQCSGRVPLSLGA